MATVPAGTWTFGNFTSGAIYWLFRKLQRNAQGELKLTYDSFDQRVAWFEHFDI